MLRRHALSLLATALLGVCNPAAAQLQPAPALPLPVLDALRAAAIPEDAVSALVLRGDKTVLSHLADRPLHPASTMKLVTTLIALDRLGPVFRGRTELRTTGELKNGLLHGDLVLRGGADVDLSTETLTTMLRSLRYQGIRTIDGNLVVDRSLFNPARADVGVPPFDEWPDAYYNVIPDAVFVNRNMLQLDLRSTPRPDGKPATRVRVAMQPELDGVAIESDMKLIDADCGKWEDGWKRPDVLPRPNGGLKVVLHGTFPKNCVASDSINVIDRQEYVARLVRRIWKSLGGTLAGTAVEGPTPPGARLLAEHVSRALPEIVRDVNKPSDNTLARLLFLSLGALEPDPVLGSHPQADTTVPTLARSEAVVRAWLRAHGIDDTGLLLENGSGLSRIERVTPIQMGGLLQAGLRSNWAPEFQASMPIAAVDGTMRRRLVDSPAAGRARLKTGTMSDVVALAGYVPDADGRPCVLVAVVNSDRAGNGRGRAVLDALVDWVARLDGTTPAVNGRVDGSARP
ncbi:D-alanyl-D-alanine carboxypeptidase/D-alanyl-D-alanine-endopeptidase [Massilia sp. TW-1]|uniref:D-alanyl-D-alanine carboxypeptidase/D-alanyl-D-alanine-endopeptidase n=1 Tax=Telluria antibiotica TaxID=2717319 RepID=A0ABX0PIM8_9BURK|nr:D-alanyl-D-alanine carboxypeptidase/D-alanyl-D-alanine-endopeptidase [Telluria antibiotica]NIA56289.1 D-alanyl-D-alanine carboxypeptidase/D-alanyl-D-alanine-endopeptidase [Telluria antibiotica]